MFPVCPKPTFEIDCQSKTLLDSLLTHTGRCQPRGPWLLRGCTCYSVQVLGFETRTYAGIISEDRYHLEHACKIYSEISMLTFIKNFRRMN